MASIRSEISIAAPPEQVWNAARDVGTAMTHHNASLHISTENGGTRVVWIADLLPNELAPGIRMMMDQGLAVMRHAMEAEWSAGQPG